MSERKSCRWCGGEKPPGRGRSHCSMQCTVAAHRAVHTRFNRKRRDHLRRIKVARGCIRCGYDKHPAALDFHHTDPATKAFALTRSPGRKREDQDAEIAKCVVLCANCHRIEHAREA